MKRLTALAIFAIATLAGCGGGGGGVTPQPTQSNPPKSTQYSVMVKFAGGATLRTPQSVRRSAGQNTMQGVVLHPLDSSTSTSQLPVEMAVAPLNNGDEEEFDHVADAGTATIVVAPQPSATPSVSLSPSGLALSVQPIASPPPGSAGPQFNVSQSTITSPASGSLVAAVSGSVNQTVTVPTYVIERTVISCGDNAVYGYDSQIHPEDQSGAVQFHNGTALTETDTAQADVYFDGPHCTVNGTYNSTEAQATLHFPYGAVYASSVASPFATLSAATWSNSFTSQTYAQLVASATAVTNPGDELLVKTADGHIVKLALTSELGSGAQGNETMVEVNYDYEESGFSVDGF